MINLTIKNKLKKYLQKFLNQEYFFKEKNDKN